MQSNCNHVEGEFLPVKDHMGLVKDPSSSQVKSVNHGAYKRRLAIIAKERNRDNQIKSLSSELESLKVMVLNMTRSSIEVDSNGN